jgi:thymidylate synthase
MNNLDKDYQSLLKDILENGVEKEDRTGTGTISVFGRQIRHNMKDGFPLLTTKKMALKSIMTELKWFLKGDTNIKYLVDNNCNVWNGDAYKKYTTELGNHYINGGDIFTESQFIDEIKTDDNFAEEWGDLGPIYGKQWREWKQFIPYNVTKENCQVAVKVTDQIQNLINELKTNPDSRRLMVSAWNVGEIDEMTLPPCHYGFQVYTRKLSMEERMDYALSKNDFRFTDDIINDEDYEKYNIPTRAISLMWNQRSVDTFLGLPFNIASYGMLLHLLAEEVNMVPGELIGNLGDTHLYSNHVEQAKEQISREPMEFLPKLKLSNVDVLDGEFDYEILHYQSHPAIKAPLSN